VSCSLISSNDENHHQMVIPKKRASLKAETLGTFRFPFNKVYCVGEKINEGGFGVIHKTHHVLNVEESFAVKIIDLYESESGLKEVLNELRILSRLQHIPNVIPLIDYYAENDISYIVQELAEGGDVLDRLIEKSTYTESDTKELMIFLLKTMDKVHECKIVHRDLKPENLLLKNKCSDAKIFLCDFGASKKLPDNADEGLISMVGTPEYCAPEVVNGEVYNEKIDSWSIGVILYLLFCGYYPFGEAADSMDDLCDNILNAKYDYDDEAWDYVPRDAKVLIDNLLTLNPNERWSPSDALKQSRWLNEKERICPSKLVHMGVSQNRIKSRILKSKMKAAGNVIRSTICLRQLLGSSNGDMMPLIESSESSTSTSSFDELLGV